MRERFPGFYRPSDEEVEAFFGEGLVCPDANILLSLYRVSEQTREDVFSVFESLGERLWLPHQVVLEFQRNRRAVIREQEQVYDQLEKELQSFPGRLLGKVRRHHPRIDRADLDEVVKTAVGEIESHLDDLRAAHPDPLESDDTLGADSVRDRLEEIVGGRIGRAMDPAEVERAGKERYAKGIPPGYADSEKGDSRQYGDVAVWLELLAEAGQHEESVVFVTDDVKEDWWVLDGDQIVGPRPELVQEMQDTASSDFWMFRFESFLTRAAKHFDFTLGEASRAEVTEAHEPRVTLPPQWQWTQFPFPLGSGAIGGHRDPSQTEFVFSPSNPLVHNAARFPVSEFNWQLRKPTEVEAAEDSVRLRLQRGASLVEREVTCSVTDPQGVTTSASVSTLQATVEVAYPFDDGDRDRLRPGTYRYSWMETEGPGSVLVVIGNGDFTIAQ